MRYHIIRWVSGLIILVTLLSGVRADLITVDSIGDVGSFSSLAIVNGNPAVSYYDQTNGDLKYVRATDASGATWGTPMSVDTTGNVGKYPYLAIVNGNPAIGYYDQTNGTLKYVRATDTTGTTWGSPVGVDTTGNIVIFSMTLIMVNGNPTMSYFDQTNSKVKYVRATDTTGTAWGTPINVANGVTPSMTIVNGIPAISYMNAGLKYIRATDASGTAWGLPLSVDTVGNLLYPSMTIINGTPALSYYNAATFDLKYVRATDANGTTWDTPLNADTTGFVGTQSSLTVVNGNPAISYFDFGNNDLKYVRATDTSGTAWGTPVSMDTAAMTGAYTSMTVANGNPAISYFDFGNNDLRYARACDADGTVWTACTVTVAFDKATTSTAEAAGMGNILRVTTSDGTPTTSAVTVTVTVTGGTATAADYALTGTITIPAGTLNNALVSIASGFTITDDAVVEANETVDLQLSAPVNAVLGAQTTTTHTIVDDDMLVSTSTPAPASSTSTSAGSPQIGVFDPAISKLGFLLPGQLGAKGEALEWVITVSNVGTAAGTNVVVTDTLRSELRVDRVAAPDGTVNIAGQTVSVTFATLQPGQSVQFSIFTTVLDGVSVDNTACVQAAGITTECATAPAIQFLPSTGEPPLWSILLRGSVVMVAVSSIVWLMFRWGR